MEKQKMKKPFYKKWLSMVIVLIVVIGIIPIAAGCGTDNTAQTGSDTAATTTEEETTKAEEKTISINASDLFDAYDANEVKADEKYKGKLLKISGTIKDIGKEIMDDSYITLKSSNPYEIISVQCMFSDEAEAKKLGDLKKGDKIKILGECDGVTVNVLIKDCKIVK